MVAMLHEIAADGEGSNAGGSGCGFAGIYYGRKMKNFFTVWDLEGNRLERKDVCSELLFNILHFLGDDIRKTVSTLISNSIKIMIIATYNVFGCNAFWSVLCIFSIFHTFGRSVGSVGQIAQGYTRLVLHRSKRRFWLTIFLGKNTG
jgi:hypothetical protein